jgi:hypothetical protein
LIKSKIQQYYLSKRIIISPENIKIIKNEDIIKVESISNQILNKSDITGIRKLILNKLYSKQQKEEKREKIKQKIGNKSTNLTNLQIKENLTKVNLPLIKLELTEQTIMNFI